jgi:hypothetical protein
MNDRMLMICALAALLTGCSSSNQPKSPEKSAGRSDTRVLEGASAVGYDGKAIRKNVDDALRKTDDRTSELDKELK